MGSIVVAGIAIVAGLLAGAPAAQAAEVGINSVVPGTGPNELVVQWTAPGASTDLWIGVANAAAGLGNCDYSAWNAAFLANESIMGWTTPRFVASGADSFTTTVSGTLFNGAGGFTVYRSGSYSLCLFEGAGVSGMGFGSAAQYNVAAPAPWFQAVGRDSSTAACAEGWNPSWAQWPNGGTGGWVCNREQYWDSSTAAWAYRDLSAGKGVQLGSLG
jgi:hypothetical protein